MKAADVMADLKDDAIRFAAFDAIGKFANAATDFRNLLHDEGYDSGEAKSVVDTARAACMFLAPNLQEPVNRALGIIDAREELAELFASRRHNPEKLEQETNWLVATMIVRDLLGLPAKKVWPSCECGESNRDVRDWFGTGTTQCWACYEKTRKAKSEPQASAPL